MHLTRLAVVLAFTLLVCGLPRTAAELVVDSWSIDVGIQNSVLGQPSPSAYFQVVQNPFTGLHTASVGSSYATATYDFGWLGNFAHFDAYTNHHLEHLEGSTITEGRIHLVPAVDSTISFNGTWLYSWPGTTTGATVFVLDVYDLTADEDVAQAAAQGGNVGLGPPFGTFNLQNSGSLLAGREYEVFYFARISLFTDLPPGAHGEGSGEIHFTLTPVPEPATLALFALSLLIPRRR